MKSLTPFGKLVRKHRIDKEMTLSSMAKSMKISSAHLSALETGKKDITRLRLIQIKNILELDEMEAAKLDTAAYCSKKEIRIKVAGLDEVTREVVALFARGINDRLLSEESLTKIKEILEQPSHVEEKPKTSAPKFGWETDSAYDDLIDNNATMINPHLRY